MGLLESLQQLRIQAASELDACDSPDAVERWRIKFLGSKGALKAAMAQLKDVPKADKPAAGKALNETKQTLQKLFNSQSGGQAKTQKASRPIVDVTLPGERPTIGHAHLITQTINEICEIFGRMGFAVAEGPEVEDEWHNFVALNIPTEHPARDPLDNFYIDESTMLRSQTSTIQIRVMEQNEPPIRVVATGRVYRPDTVDATHMFMFNQVEGLYVDEGVTMADLRTCVDQFCKAYFGPETATRFRPHFFPFTEPSAEIDVSCYICHGDGCSLCKQSGWIEIAGCGMVDPNVLEAVGYDSEKYTGFAFGMGIERMLTRKHKIPDIRLLFENDVRFLRQF